MRISLQCDVQIDKIGGLLISPSLVSFGDLSPELSSYPLVFQTLDIGVRKMSCLIMIYEFASCTYEYESIHMFKLRLSGAKWIITT